MTADFWVAAILVSISTLFVIVHSFMSNVIVGIVGMLVGLAGAGMTLWTQHCVRAGGCTVLAWILVALYAAGFALSILSLVLWNKTKKSLRKWERDDDDDDDYRRRRRGGHWRHGGRDEDDDGDRRHGGGAYRRDDDDDRRH